MGTRMDQNEVESMQDAAAQAALRARTRIEAGVATGELPRWVLDVCNHWERSSVIYGAARAHLQLARTMMRGMAQEAVSH